MTADPNLTANLKKLKNFLMNNMDKKIWLTDKVVSGGRLNVFEALSTLMGSSYPCIDMSFVDNRQELVKPANEGGTKTIFILAFCLFF